MPTTVTPASARAGGAAAQPDQETVTGTMLAVRLARRGGPDQLEVVRAPVPVPAADEVLVRVRTVGVNRLDLVAMAGTGPGASAALPRIVGLDPAGTVVAVGRDGDPALLGRTVVARPTITCGTCPACLHGADADCRRARLLGVHRDGGAAQLVAVPLTNVIDVTGVDPAAATVAVHSAPIALHALRAGDGPRAGTTVLVTGASGGVGRAAVQIAARAGATVLAASTSRSVDDGGAVPVRHTGADDLVAAVHAVAPEGVDLALDGSGTAALASAAARCLAWRGRLVVVGASDGGTLQLDARALYQGRRSVIGTASADRADVVQALDLVRQGVVRPVVGPRFPLERARDAYAALVGRDRGGKVVLDVP